MRKSIKFFVLLSIILPLHAHAIVHHKNPQLRKKVLELMETFCQDAGGTVATFENTCGNSCIMYDRKTGEKLPEIELKQICEEKQIFSCRCPQNQCLKDRICQNIKQ